MKFKFFDLFGGSEIDTDSAGFGFPEFKTTSVTVLCLGEGTHCYCAEDTTPPRTKLHMKCCMCGHVKLSK